MYAIILDGPKQLKVTEGQELRVDLRSANPGDKITFDKVLAVSKDDKLIFAADKLKSATVTAEVIGGALGPKLVVQKFRRRKNSRRKNGHRQASTRIRIEKISL